MGGRMPGTKSAKARSHWAALLLIAVTSTGAQAESASFVARRDFAAGRGPKFVAVSDFNRDGRADLAVVNTEAHEVSVILGNGDGTFQQPISVGPINRDPRALAAADFNGDGIPDLAVVESYLGQVFVFLGNGDGTFDAARTSRGVIE